MEEQPEVKQNTWGSVQRLKYDLAVATGYAKDFEAKLCERVADVARLEARIDWLLKWGRLDVARDREEMWYWQGDGEDHLESLTCPVLIEAADLRAILAQVVSQAVSDE